MVKKYDIVRLLVDNACMTGLGAGSEHYVGICKEDKATMGILDEYQGEWRILWIRKEEAEVIGSAKSNMTRLFIDEIVGTEDYPVSRRSKNVASDASH